MRITTWNVRGLNSPRKKCLLKQNISLFEPAIILILETKLNKEGIKLERKMGRWNIILQESRGASGGLDMIWIPTKITLDMINSNHNWMGYKSRVSGIISKLP